ncbi:hypothetical protein [Nocardioides convexus]|uniref:hypothetical protein n=1 Tax=Nocardioides convexus TaxID=2712224 RepID=UPI00241850A1|nr:hypothetical protein [Nocardioides convexus]
MNPTPRRRPAALLAASATALLGLLGLTGLTGLAGLTGLPAQAAPTADAPDVPVANVQAHLQKSAGRRDGQRRQPACRERGLHGLDEPT